jgi:hypothetical protein
MRDVSFHGVLLMRLAKVIVASLIPTSALLAAEPPMDAAALKVHLMEVTKIVAVMGINGPAKDFKDDGDPDTLQIVFLDKKSDGPSRVSPDGEVIFLYKASDKEQQKLIDQAFDLRVARRLSGS